MQAISASMSDGESFSTDESHECEEDEDKFETDDEGIERDHVDREDGGGASSPGCPERSGTCARLSNLCRLGTKIVRITLSFGS